MLAQQAPDFDWNEIWLTAEYLFHFHESIRTTNYSHCFKILYKINTVFYILEEEHGEIEERIHADELSPLIDFIFLIFFQTSTINVAR